MTCRDHFVKTIEWILTEPNANVWPFFTTSFVRKNVYKLTLKTRFIVKQANSLYYPHFTLLSLYHRIYEDDNTHLLLEHKIISDKNIYLMKVH